MPIILYKLPDWSALEICCHKSMLAVQIYLQLLGFSLIPSLLKVTCTVLCFCNRIIMQVSIWPVTIPPPPPPPRTDCRTTNYFSVKIPAPRTALRCTTPAPGSKNEAKSPPPDIICLLNAKISIQNEHNSIKAVFREWFLSKFSIIVRLTVFFYRENKVFACPYKHLRLTVWKQFENHSHCGRWSIPQWLCRHVLYTSFLGFPQTKHAACFTFPKTFYDLNLTVLRRSNKSGR